MLSKSNFLNTKKRGFPVSKYSRRREVCTGLSRQFFPYLAYVHTCRYPYKARLTVINSITYPCRADEEKSALENDR